MKVILDSLSTRLGSTPISRVEERERESSGTGPKTLQFQKHFSKEHFFLPVGRYRGIVSHLILICFVKVVLDEALLLRIRPDGADTVDCF